MQIKIKNLKKGFSLVELLVVITIIAILSVVAYTALGGQTAKARDSRRMQDIATIQSALEIYFVSNNRFPAPIAYVDTTVEWGYNAAVEPTLSNTFTGTISGKEVNTPDGEGGGLLTIVGGDYDTYTVQKGVIDHSIIKSLLNKLPTDPTYAGLVKQGSDIPLPEETGLGQYLYAILKKNTKPIAYQLAATLEGEENANKAYIVGNYDDTATGAPDSLFCTDDNTPGDDELTAADTCIVDGDKTNFPYPVDI